MKKLIIIAISALALTACSTAYSSGKTKNVGQSPVTEANQTNKTLVRSLSEEKDGVTVEIQNIQKANDQTTLTVVMTNHTYNLADMDVDGLSSFNGIKPTSYTIQKTLMGGHHVTADLAFQGEQSGKLTIGLNDELIFNFNIE